MEVIAGIAYLVGIATGLWYLIVMRPPPRAQYRIVIIQVFFSIAAALSITFGANAEFKGDFGKFSLVLFGPPALLAGLLFLWMVLVPDRDIFAAPRVTADNLESVTDVIDSVERADGWLSYETWKDRIPGFVTLFRGDEEYMLRNFLEGAFGPHERQRVTEPVITTLFAYLSPAEGVLKFQRIAGPRPAAGGNPYIRFRSNNSFGGRPSSVLLVNTAGAGNPIRIGENATDRDTATFIQDGYAEITQPRIDCLIVSHYGDYPVQEDYAVVDLRRFSQTGTGRVFLAVASAADPLSDASLWGMRRSLASREGRVPLGFRGLGSAVGTDLGETVASLDGWAAALDGAAANPMLGPQVKAALAAFAARLAAFPAVGGPVPVAGGPPAVAAPAGPFTQAFKAMAAVPAGQRLAARVEAASDAVVLMFHL